MIGRPRRHWRFIDWMLNPAHVIAQVQWDPGMLAVGVFWHLERFRGECTGWENRKGDYIGRPWTLHLYLAIIPTLPLHVSVFRIER